MTLFGPHCSHNTCSMLVCDMATDLQSGVEHACREQSGCPYCGPSSPNWPRIATQWLAWCAGQYGTTDPAELDRPGMYPNVVATARLVAAHPVPEGSR